MTITDQVHSYLVKEPRFRERSARMRGIADLLIQNYGLEIDRRVLAEVIADAGTMDRAWRDILKHNEHLRGSDYDEKAELEFNKQQELGYYPK